MEGFFWVFHTDLREEAPSQDPLGVSWLGMLSLPSRATGSFICTCKVRTVSNQNITHQFWAMLNNTWANHSTHKSFNNTIWCDVYHVQMCMCPACCSLYDQSVSNISKCRYKQICWKTIPPCYSVERCPHSPVLAFVVQQVAGELGSPLLVSLCLSKHS